MTKEKLTEKRVALIAQARAMLDKAKGEKRDATNEERETYDKLMEEVGDIKTQIADIEADEQRSAALEAEEAALEESRGRRSQQPQPGEKADEPKSIEIRAGQTIQLGERDTTEYRKAFTGMLSATTPGAETRALSQGTDSAGGYLVPEAFAVQLIQAIDNEVFIRRLATVLPVGNASSLGVPSLDADPADADWTTELLTGDPDTAMATGKREFTPNPVAKSLKVSKTLLRNSVIPVDALVRARLAYKFAVTQEKAFLTGNGSGKPLGVFTASANGITTGRDVSTGNTATAITFDGLKAAKYSLRAGYRNNAQWIFHRDAILQVSKLKDENGQYLWQPSNQIGKPDMLLGSPVNESEYAPNTFTTGLYVGIIGDFSNYWIADSLSMTIQVLTELYAATNQNGYIGRMECDGMPVLSEAFSRVKLA